MSRRTVGVVSVVVVLALAALALPGLLVRAPVPPPTRDLFGDAVYASGTHPAPDFNLRSVGGGEVRLSSLRGRVVLLTFMDSLCTTDCPIEAAELHQMQQQLGRRSPLILVVSTDPAGDTRANVGKFLDRYHLAGPLQWVTGSPAQLARVWRAYSIEVSSASNHSSGIYVIDRWGDEREGWGVPFPEGEFDQAVARVTARYLSGWRWPWNL